MNSAQPKTKVRISDARSHRAFTAVEGKRRHDTTTFRNTFHGQRVAQSARRAPTEVGRKAVIEAINYQVLIAAVHVLGLGPLTCEFHLPWS